MRAGTSVMCGLVGGVVRRPGGVCGCGGRRLVLAAPVCGELAYLTFCT